MVRFNQAMWLYLKYAGDDPGEVGRVRRRQRGKFRPLVGIGRLFFGFVGGSRIGALLRLNGGSIDVFRKHCIEVHVVGGHLKATDKSSYYATLHSSKVRAERCEMPLSDLCFPMRQIKTNYILTLGECIQNNRSLHM